MEQAILQFFESIRCPALTYFFGFFSLFGEPTVFAVVVILVYWLANARTGEQLALSALTSLPVNVALKLVVARPRPYAAGAVSRLDVDTPLFSTVGLGDNVSFPSGHSQCAANYLCGVSAHARRTWVWAIASVCTLLVMCSRLYFGVHYPTDVLLGAFLGIVIAVCWELIYTRAHGVRLPIACGAAILALALAPLFPETDYMQAAGLLAGAALALSAEDFCPAPKDVPFPRRLWRIPAGLLFAGGAFALTFAFPDAPAWELVGWFLVAFAAVLPARRLFYLLKI